MGVISDISVCQCFMYVCAHNFANPPAKSGNMRTNTNQGWEQQPVGCGRCTNSLALFMFMLSTGTYFDFYFGLFIVNKYHAINLLSGSKWGANALTWCIEDYPTDDLTKQETDYAMNQAFSVSLISSFGQIPNTICNNPIISINSSMTVEC